MRHSACARITSNATLSLQLEGRCSCCKETQQAEKKGVITLSNPLHRRLSNKAEITKSLYLKLLEAANRFTSQALPCSSYSCLVTMSSLRAVLSAARRAPPSQVDLTGLEDSQPVNTAYAKDTCSVTHSGARAILTTHSAGASWRTSADLSGYD